MAAKRISPTRQQYNIERGRAERRMQKQLQLPLSIIRKMMPAVPKRATQKSIKELREIKSKRGKYQKNKILAIYSQYINTASPTEMREYFAERDKYKKEKIRRQEIARKKRALPEKEQFGPSQSLLYDYAQETGDELYTTLNEMFRLVDNILNSAKPTGYVEAYYGWDQNKAKELRGWLYAQIETQGKEIVAKKLHAMHDEAISATYMLLESGKEAYDEAWGILNYIMSINPDNDHNIDAATYQMDSTYEQ